MSIILKNQRRFLNGDSQTRATRMFIEDTIQPGSMRVGSIAIIGGFLLITFGTIFQFQGKGQLGPESSFMYHNKDWIDYGMLIIVTGIISVLIGGFFALRRSCRK